MGGKLGNCNSITKKNILKKGRQNGPTQVLEVNCKLDPRFPSCRSKYYASKQHQLPLHLHQVPGLPRNTLPCPVLPYVLVSITICVSLRQPLWHTFLKRGQGRIGATIFSFIISLYPKLLQVKPAAFHVYLEAPANLQQHAAQGEAVNDFSCSFCLFFYSNTNFITQDYSFTFSPAPFKRKFFVMNWSTHLSFSHWFTAIPCTRTWWLSLDLLPEGRTSGQLWGNRSPRAAERQQGC